MASTDAPKSLDVFDLIGCTREQLCDPYWRLNTLYRIITEDGSEIPFRMNEAQRELFARWWYCNIILKARKQGFTTLICLMALDQCVFRNNFSAGIIAHSKPDAETIFRKRIKWVWDHLPPAIRAANPIVKDTQSELVFASGSSISVGTSFRGDTPQFLHISEMGKIARRFPEKSREIMSGALESVSAGQFIVVESTAEGNGGDYHNLVTAAQRVRDSGRQLTEVDFRLHFYPWWKKKSNRVSNPHAVAIPSHLIHYFNRIEKETGTTLDAGQRAWYALKYERLGEDLMKQEHPSTEAEPFEVADAGAIYAKEMAWLRRHGRIGRFPAVPGIPVNTFWDWGINDNTFIWCHQRINSMDRFVWCYQAHNEALKHYADILRDTGYAFGAHYVPHDFDARRPGLTVNRTLSEMFAELGVKPQVLVPRVVDKRQAIQEVKRVLPNCEFDAEDCADGIECLDNHSWEWDEQKAVWKGTPRDSQYKHGADAFEQFALMWEDLKRLGPTQVPQREKKRPWIGSKRTEPRRPGWKGI